MEAWMADRGNAGRRPFAWWQFDAPARRDPEIFPNEHDALNAWGVLASWEYEKINEQWREWFGDDYYEAEEKL